MITTFSVITVILVVVLLVTLLGIFLGKISPNALEPVIWLIIVIFFVFAVFGNVPWSPTP